MEQHGPLDKLLKEYSDYQIDLGVQNKIKDLLKDRVEYDKDLEENNKRDFIREEIISNFELLNDIDEILGFIEI